MPARDVDLWVVGRAGVDEGRALEVVDRAVGTAYDVEPLAAVIAQDADQRPLEVATYWSSYDRPYRLTRLRRSGVDFEDTHQSIRTSSSGRASVDQ